MEVCFDVFYVQLVSSLVVWLSDQLPVVAVVVITTTATTIIVITIIIVIIISVRILLVGSQCFNSGLCHALVLSLHPSPQLVSHYWTWAKMLHML